MKCIYYLLKSILLIFGLIVNIDYLNYFHAEEKIVTNIESIKKAVSYDLGITENLKNELLKDEIFLIYEKPNGTIGEMFSFSVATNYKVLLTNQLKSIEIELIILLGY